MNKTFRIAVFVLIVGITVVTLTSGTSKEYNGGERNLVDELYSQAVKQNDNLGSIEDDIERFYKKRDDAMEKYSGFTAYNSRYYSDAREKAATIADMDTRQKANDIISKSEAGYTAKLTDWQNTIASLNAGVKELNDLHALLKIIITEPIMVKYQNTSFPDNAKLKETNGDLLKVIEKIKVITK